MAMHQPLVRPLCRTTRVRVCLCVPVPHPPADLCGSWLERGDSPEQQRSRAYESRASPAASAGHDSGTYMDRTHGSGGGDGMGGGAGGTAAASRTRAGAPRLRLPGCARNAQRGRDSLPQTAGLRLSPEDARRLHVTLKVPCAGPAPPSLGAGPLRRRRGQNRTVQRMTDNDALDPSTAPARCHRARGWR